MKERTYPILTGEAREELIQQITYGDERSASVLRSELDRIGPNPTAEEILSVDFPVPETILMAGQHIAKIARAVVGVPVPSHDWVIVFRIVDDKEFSPLAVVASSYLSKAVGLVSSAPTREEAEAKVRTLENMRRAGGAGQEDEFHFHAFTRDEWELSQTIGRADAPK